MAKKPSPAPAPSGYRKKPFWIYVASVVFILAPLFNYMLSLASLGVREWYKPSTLIAWIPYIDGLSAIVMGLVFLSGILLLVFVRKWSWYLCLATLLTVLVFTIIRWESFKLMGPVILTSMLVATLAATVTVYTSRFRQPYLNPRIRWWETSKRYKVDIPVQVSDWPFDGTLIDISQTGLLIQWSEKKKIPKLEGSTLISISKNLALPCTVARRTEHGYGLAFGNLDSDEKKGLKHFLATLARDPSRLHR